jgi:hypothetical protein
MRKDHGDHNLKLANKLISDGGYSDWVVTTSFYSAVHFVEHALFPLIVGNIEYPSFNEFWQLTESRKTTPLNLHTTKKNLARKYIPSVAGLYRELLDDCHSARYNNYIVSPGDAVEAKKKAEAIRKKCLEIKP